MATAEHTSRSTMKRPRGIVVLACVLALSGLVFLLGAGALLFAKQLAIYPGTIALAGVNPHAELATGLAALCGGMAQLGLAIGLFRLWRWAWGLSELIMGATVAVAAFGIHNGTLRSPDELIAPIAAVPILLYLLAPPVIRAFFRKPTAMTVALRTGRRGQRLPAGANTI
jgi:hypothetical protein